MVTTLDLSQSLNSNNMRLLAHYDHKLGLADYSNSTDLPLFTASALTTEFSFIGSLKEYLYKQYFMLDIRRNYGESLRSWLSQPMADINLQMRSLPGFLEARAKIIEEMANEADGKK